MAYDGHIGQVLELTPDFRRGNEEPKGDYLSAALHLKPNACARGNF